MVERLPLKQVVGGSNPPSTDMEYNEEKHEYSENGIIIPGVTTVMKDVGIIDYSIFATPGRGTRIHKIMENSIKNILDWNNITDEEIELIHRFKEITECFRFKDAEIKLHNTIYNYAGTADFMGGDCVGELKTGKPEKWHELQLSAYVYAAKLEKGVLIYLNEKNPIKVYSKSDLKNAFRHFLCALDVYTFKRSK